MEIVWSWHDGDRSRQEDSFCLLTDQNHTTFLPIVIRATPLKIRPPCQEPCNLCLQLVPATEKQRGRTALMRNAFMHWAR